MSQRLDELRAEVEWESGPTPKAALMAAGLMKGEER